VALPSPPGAAAPAASSSAGNKPVALELILNEGLDQALGFPGEPGDHPDPQTFGEGQEAAIEAAAQQYADSGGRKTFQALRPTLFSYS
jgi:hypothetical protein